MKHQSSSLSPGFEWQSSGMKPAAVATDKPTKRAPVACKRYVGSAEVGGRVCIDVDGAGVVG